MDKITESFVTIVGLIIGVATLSVIVSNNSNAAGVIQNIFSGVSNLLAVATAPVTGSQTTINSAYAGVTQGLLGGL